jgi:hypothetical protein
VAFIEIFCGGFFFSRGYAGIKFSVIKQYGRNLIGNGSFDHRKGH